MASTSEYALTEMGRGSMSQTDESASTNMSYGSMSQTELYWVMTAWAEQNYTE
jgi:hypothetical protein